MPTVFGVLGLSFGSAPCFESLVLVVEADSGCSVVMLPCEASRNWPRAPDLYSSLKLGS